MIRALTRYCLVFSGAAALLTVAIAPPEATSGESEDRCHGKPATLVGTNGPDHFGNKEIGPHEVIVLKRGKDTVSIASQDDVIVCGNAGRDTLVTDSPGSLLLVDGGGDHDTLGCMCAPDEIPRVKIKAIGGGGPDLLLGGGKDDYLDGGPGRDRLLGSFGEDLIDGGEQHDAIWGGADNDEVRGGDGNDSVSGDLHPSELQHYGGGTDVANGGDGFDHCQAEAQRNCEAPQMKRGALRRLRVRT